MALKVAIVDPSLFTWPYDSALCEAQMGEGIEAFVFGRHLAVKDQIQPLPCLYQHYYPTLRHDFFRRLPRQAFLAAKGVSHYFSNRRLVKLLRQWQPDIIHFQWLPLPMLDLGMVRALRRVAPMVLTVHDTVPFNGSPRARFQALGFQTALRQFDALVVHTEQGRRRVVKMFGDGHRVVTIPHGLPRPPGAKVTPVKPEGASLEFLMFGKLKPYKGLDILIRAAAQLDAGVRDRCLFRIVGEPFVDMASLEALARALGVADRFVFDMRFVGDDEMPPLFDRADALLFPYREIEASGVLMNALEFGRPVIASRLGAFAEYLVDDVDGLLTRPEDPAELARAISRFAGEAGLRARLDAGIRARAAEMPGWPEVARRTLRLYEEVRTAKAPRSLPLAMPAPSGN